MVIRADFILRLSLITFATGAKQFVVHDALETTLKSDLMLS